MLIPRIPSPAIDRSFDPGIPHHLVHRLLQIHALRFPSAAPCHSRPAGHILTIVSTPPSLLLDQLPGQDLAETPEALSLPVDHRVAPLNQFDELARVDVRVAALIDIVDQLGR